MVESSDLSTVELFHKCEKAVVGYQDYINADEEHYLETLKELEEVVSRIQTECTFSPNEEFGEIQTEHMKMLMAPYLQAEVLARLMDNRVERVRQAHVYFMEYLKLMKHYNLLEKHQSQKLKAFLERYKTILTGEQNTDTEQSKPKHPMEMMQRDFEDRDTKIANFKLKKALEANLDRLKDYKDEEMKREFYKMQIQLSVMQTIDNLSATEMEMQMLQHQASLSEEQRKQNEMKSAKPEVQKPLQMQYIGPEDVDKMALLFGQGAPQQQQMPVGSTQQQVVTQYVDPLQKFKPVDKVVIDQQDINGRVQIRDQYQKQVFQPAHNLPTMSIEQLAEQEYQDAMHRQQQQQAMEQERANEDPDDEEVLERNRKKDSAMDDWKDWNPKGCGNTQRM